MNKVKGKPLANPHSLHVSADRSLFLLMALECVTHPTCSLYLETALHT